jgi:hypothetical protein
MAAPTVTGCRAGRTSPRAVDELQPGRDGTVREQALARPEDDGEPPEPVLVDEVVPQQRLDQVPAAVHLRLRPVRPLSDAAMTWPISSSQ